METIGGHLTPAVGGACGVERLIAVMRAKEIAFNGKSSKRVFLAHAGNLAKKKAFAILKDLPWPRIFGSRGALEGIHSRRSFKAADNREGIALALDFGTKRNL